MPFAATSKQSVWKMCLFAHTMIESIGNKCSSHLLQLVVSIADSVLSWLLTKSSVT